MPLSVSQCVADEKLSKALDNRLCVDAVMDTILDET